MKLPLTPLRFLTRAERQFGSKVAVIDRGRRWTYREFGSRCRRLGALLRALGLSAGERVAFLAYNTHHLLEAYYGVLLAGGVLLPLNIRLSRQDLTFILNDSQARFLFLDPDFVELVEQMQPHLESVRRFLLLEKGPRRPWLEGAPLDELLSGQPELEGDWTGVEEDAVAEMFYTSGTTQRPKGVMLTHRNLYLHALQTALGMEFRDSDVQLHSIPLFHVNGWGTPQFLTCLGGCHVMLKKFDPPEVFRLIQEHRVTTFAMVPTMATTLLNFPQRDQYDVSSVRRITLGGSAANSKLVRDLETFFNCECVAGYGLTETSPVLTCATPKAHLSVQGEERYRLQAMTGFPVPGVEVTIVDEEGRELPWDGQSVGEIVARGDNVMLGYWNLPGETEEAFRGGWFHTGDMATIDPDGYVLIVDRKKDIIISGGENISSIEIENVLLQHPAVLECAVIAVPHPTWGEVPQALVVLKEGEQVAEGELLEHCRAHLAGFKVPKGVDFYPSLPKGGTGKILKRELKEKYWADFSKKVN